MKLIVAGDWHLDLIVGGYDFHDDIVEAARTVIDATHGKDALILVGDLFNTPRPSPRAYATLIELLDESACPIVIIPGNHEVVSSNKPSALEPLKKIRFYQDVKIVEYPKIVGFGGKKFLFFPYITDTKAKELEYPSAAYFVRGAFEDVLENSGGEISAAFCHLDVEGVDIGGGAFLRGGLLPMPLKIAKKLPFPIFNGHIHNRQKIEPNIWLPGSIVPTNFMEPKSKKGYLEMKV